jgi:hypothetical protein
LSRGLDYLESATSEMSAWVVWLGTEPKLDVVKSEPRFKALLLKTGNPIVERLKLA